MLQNSTKHVFGKKKRCEDWFEGNDKQIQSLLSDKKNVVVIELLSEKKSGGLRTTGSIKKQIRKRGIQRRIISGSSMQESFPFNLRTKSEKL